MYHCHIQFYFVGCRRELWEIIEAAQPLENFIHTFSESREPEEDLVKSAGVILAGLAGMEPEKVRQVLQALARDMREDAELILLAEREQMPLLLESQANIQDIWVMPLSGQELLFRFAQWQQGYKRKKDLWQAEAFLDACMNNTPNLVWFKNQDGVHVKVNDSFCKAAGKAKKQVEGRKHSYIWNVEKDDAACIASEEEVMRTRKPYVSAETIQTGDGEKQLTTYKAPLYDLDGSVMGTVGVAVDVTKEHIYEKEAIEKGQTLELLFSTLDCGVMCHSLDGKRVYSINRAALELLGYGSLEEMVADGFDAVAQSVLEEDKPALRKSIFSLKTVGDSTSTEYRVQHKDGRLLHILGNVKLIEKDGELLYQRFLLDFTFHKLQDEEQMAKWARRTKEMQYQERMFEVFSTFLADNINDVYMMMDGKGEKLEFVSTNTERVLGIPWKELKEEPGKIGRPKYHTGQEIGREGLSALEPGMALEPMETERVNPQTGEHKWFRESVYCISLQGEKKIVIYISDRTAERKTQDALRETLEMAQVANKAKSTFLSNVSHDIRTPMNAITGFITLLREDVGKPEQVAEYVEKIDAASQHLLGLINDVLDMNKIESGIAVLTMGEMNLAEVIEELNTIIRPQARAKGQIFDIYTSSLTYEHLLGDKLRVNQVMLNVLSNAVKYTQEGGRIEMRVNELPQVDENYSRIQFIVQDNGQGISKEYQKVMFNPFTREQSSVLNKIQGTGLGLAITKSLVDLMNGSIAVESSPGKGSTFTVELEFRIQKREDADPGFWEEHGVHRMIIADDDEDICQDIIRKMAGTGVYVDYAFSGELAVEMIRSARERGTPYDLILLDWKMPDLDGMETARLIRKNYQEKVPILLFSAYDWVDIEQEAMKVGVDHFLPKPFFMSNFRDAIQRVTAAREEAVPAASESVVEGKRVLVVDDISVNRLVMVKILETLGATCEMAENGQEALERFEASQPGEYDLILMDIQMPVMNGYEATRAIRASGHPSAQSVAIIAMTANAFVDDIREALESGMDAHLAKPVVLDQMKRTIREVLGRKKKESSAKREQEPSKENYN